MMLIYAIWVSQGVDNIKVKYKKLQTDLPHGLPIRARTGASRSFSQTCVIEKTPKARLMPGFSYKPLTV